MSRLMLWRTFVTVSFSIAFIIISFMFTTALIKIIDYLKIIDYSHFSALPFIFSILVGLIGTPLIWSSLNPYATRAD